jgi:hypothetical protein
MNDSEVRRLGRLAAGCVLWLVIVLAPHARAAVLLDDTWSDGTRTDQNLPMESAWYVSTASQLTAGTNALTLAVGSGSVMAVTYFTGNSASPAHLDLGDTLTVTFAVTFSGVAAPNGSQGLPIERAKRLLAESNHKLEVLASLCGYQSANSFCVAFKQATGMSPKKFHDSVVH